MHTMLSPQALEYRPEHNRSASWFATICQMLGAPKLSTTCHLQKDGSQIFKFGEDHGRNFTYFVHVWPDGSMRGGREVPNSE